MGMLSSFIKKDSIIETLNESRCLNEESDWRENSVRQVAKNITMRLQGTNDPKEVSLYLKMFADHVAEIYKISPEQAWEKSKIYFPNYNNMTYDQISNSADTAGEGTISKIVRVSKQFGLGDTLGRTLANKLTNYRKTGKFGG